MRKDQSRKNRFRILAVMCAALGWWGLLYPELTLTPETVRIVAEDSSAPGTNAEQSRCPDDSLYLALLRAEPGKIHFRSRLLTELNAFWEAFSWDRSTKN